MLARNAATLAVDVATLSPQQLSLAILGKLNCRKLGLNSSELFPKRINSEEYVTDKKKTKLHGRVRERTIPTERPHMLQITE
jgi:hypothetical protein